MWKYKPRWIAKKLIQAIDFSPVVILSGARQTGKSTLLRHEKPFKDWPYYTLDDLDVRELAEKEPDELAAIHDRVVIDEVQKAPQLMAAIKKQVDSDRNKRFVLSGSANLLLMKTVTETLAGRCLYFELLPFALGEAKERNTPQWIGEMPGEISNQNFGTAEPLTDFQMLRGFLPPVTFLKTESQLSEWWIGYIRTYLERDLRAFSQVTNLPDFRKVMQMLAARSAQILNQANIARSAGVSQATANRYINLLEISGLFGKLQPYSKNVKKRIVKSPKIFCLDTGLMCSLAGVKKIRNIDPDLRGHIFETLVHHNLLAIAAICNGNLYYIRKQGGLEREVDFLLEVDGKVIAIEAKASEKLDLKAAENIARLKEMIPNILYGLVIYNGTRIKKLRKDIFAVPCGML